MRPEVDLIPVLPHRKLQRVVVYVILGGVKFIININHHVYLCFISINLNIPLTDDSISCQVESKCVPLFLIKPYIFHENMEPSQLFIL